MQIKKYIPILEWLPGYTKSQLKGDTSAGLTAGVMLIPQGMAYSMLAGLPPIYGLYASIVPLIIYAIFGTSRQLAVGPAAMVALLISAGVAKVADIGSDEFISFAILLAFMVGVLQLTLGLLRLGFLVNFLSKPVLSGFTSAAALMIGLSQLKHLFGFELTNSSYVYDIVGAAIQKIGQINLPTFILGAAAIVLILILKKVKRSIPGSLVVVILSIAAVYLLNLHEVGVIILKDVPEGLPAFKLPAANLESFKILLPTAFTIALVGFLQSIAVAKSIQSKQPGHRVQPNQELVAQGLSNIGGSFFQSFPTSGGFARTAVAIQAGAKTGMASIISAVLIALTLLFFTPLFYYLPNAILASVIMVAVFGLIDIKEVKHLWKSDKRDLAMLIITFLGTLFLGIEEGIIIGVVLSLLMIIFQTTRPHYAILGKMPGTKLYKNIERFTEAEQRDNILVFRLDARLYFANVDFFKDAVEEAIIDKGEKLELFVLDAASINSLDSSAIHALEEILIDCKGRKVKFVMTGVKGPVRDAIFRSGFIQDFGNDSFYLTVNEAVESFGRGESTNFGNMTLQTDEGK